MKTYSFEVNRRSLIIKIVLAVTLFGIIAVVVTGMYAHSLFGLTLLLAIVIIFLPLFFLKKFIRREVVTIKDNGFYIKSQDRFIEWRELTWYKTGANNSPLIDILEFGIADGIKVSFPFYKKSKTQNDWPDFRKDLVHLVGVNCPDLKNYYQIKVFQLYSKYVFVFWVLVPAVLLLLGATKSNIFLTTTFAIIGTVPLLSAIKRNQHQELN